MNSQPKLRRGRRINVKHVECYMWKERLFERWDGDRVAVMGEEVSYPCWKFFTREPYPHTIEVHPNPYWDDVAGKAK